MKIARFYLLQQDPPSASLTAAESLACELSAQEWRSGKRVLIACQSQEQAEKLDEALWAREPSDFIPHNLAGEGPHYGSPIELCWPEKRGNASRSVLINLQPQFADFATVFHDVIDFVPHEEERKVLARERYKAYRRVGFNLKTLPAPAIND